jgi:multidrug efflux pump
MEADAPYRQGADALDRMVVVNNKGESIPFSAFAHYEATYTSLGVSHQGGFPASTISFNLSTGVSFSEASAAIDDAMRQIGLPSSVHGSMQGTGSAFKNTFSSLPWLIVAAILAIYIVLGMLYESLIHPLTILSTLPSAGVGALLALMLFKTDFSIIAFIGVLLLIGIVKKNAIMMIDFALHAERSQGLGPREAIYEACLLRFRPIMMTTLAALLGAVPLAVGHGDGAELRTPLGISIIGGLLLSQVLTLYTTPVVYLYLDRFRLWSAARFTALRRNRRPASQESA